jgi:MerR family transcriptional regulator, copper efflux regulator
MMRPVRHLPVAPSVPDSWAGDAPSLAPANFGAPIASPELEDIQEIAEDGEKLLQVGDIAKASGKTVRAIHHYEDVGLLRPHARSKGRYRLYDQAALNRVRWIGKLHDLGLSLSQIQEMVEAWEKAPSAPGAMSRIRALYTQKLEETRAQIAHLASLERELEASIDYLDTCGTACDPAELVRACTNCDHHDRSLPEPELVAGIRGSVGQRSPHGNR